MQTRDSEIYMRIQREEFPQIIKCFQFSDTEKQTQELNLISGLALEWSLLTCPLLILRYISVSLEHRESPDSFNPPIP